MNTVATNTEKGSASERSTSKQKTSKRKVRAAARQGFEREINVQEEHRGERQENDHSGR